MKGILKSGRLRWPPSSRLDSPGTEQDELVSGSTNLLIVSGHDKKQFLTCHMIAEVNLAADTVPLRTDMEEETNKATDYDDF